MPSMYSASQDDDSVTPLFVDSLVEDGEIWCTVYGEIPSCCGASRVRHIQENRFYRKPSK